MYCSISSFTGAKMFVANKFEFFLPDYSASDCGAYFKLSNEIGQVCEIHPEKSYQNTFALTVEEMFQSKNFRVTDSMPCEINISKDVFKKISPGWALTKLAAKNGWDIAYWKKPEEQVDDAQDDFIARFSSATPGGLIAAVIIANKEMHQHHSNGYYDFIMKRYQNIYEIREPMRPYL